MIIEKISVLVVHQEWSIWYSSNKSYFSRTCGFSFLHYVPILYDSIRFIYHNEIESSLNHNPYNFWNKRWSAKYSRKDSSWRKKIWKALVYYLPQFGVSTDQYGGFEQIHLLMRISFHNRKKIICNPNLLESKGKTNCKTKTH